MAKVFISHRSGETLLVERLAKELSTAGHAVTLDMWDLHVSDSIVDWMNSGLRDADYVVVCYSDGGGGGPWMNREWMSALARQLNGERVRIVPAKLPGGTSPAVLADLKYADLETDWSSGVQQILAVLT